MQVAIAGAGMTGATIARLLAEAGHNIIIYEQRNHVAGNCHTQEEQGVLVHRYGAHIFHTDNEEVWQFVNRFGKWSNYRHKVLAHSDGQLLSMPVNLLTMCQLAGMAMTPSEARKWVDEACIFTTFPKNFEQLALSTVGKKLYKAIYEGYTEKQWGVHPSRLPASVFSRLPVRYSADDNYYFHKYQAMPENGYTAVVEAMLDHDNIEVRLNSNFEATGQHTIWTGALDAYFQFSEGRLRYRTLDFARVQGESQGVPVINYTKQKPYTRIVEHNLLTSTPQTDVVIQTQEFSRDCGTNDTPYYPMRLVDDVEVLANYQRLAQEQKGVTFAGRLGKYKYIDMDVAIAEAMTTANQLIEQWQ